jgi:hypothetical protein
MRTMRLRKNLSEDVDFPSLFLVLDAKGGEGDLSLLAFLYIPWVVICD